MGIKLTFEVDDSDDQGDDHEDTRDPTTQQELIEAVRDYAIEQDIADMEEVDVQISTKMKRTAGKAGKARKRKPYDYLMRLAWGAFKKWGWDDRFKGVVRHELVHLKEFQQYGTSGHGARFKRMAREVDAPRHCEKFTDHNYELYCSDCGKVVAERYQRSKKIKNPGDYRTKCCNAKCKSRGV